MVDALSELQRFSATMELKRTLPESLAFGKEDTAVSGSSRHAVLSSCPLYIGSETLGRMFEG